MHRWLVLSLVTSGQGFKIGWGYAVDGAMIRELFHGIFISKIFNGFQLGKVNLPSGLFTNIFVPQLRFFGDKFFHHLNTFPVI